MKIALLILTLIIIPSSFGQAKLTVHIKDSRKSDSFPYLEEFKLYRNDTLVKTVHPRHEHIQTLKKLPFGNYSIKYETIFKKTESINFILNKKKDNGIDLNIDFIDHENESHIAFIGKLENGEHYKIRIQSSGCFYHSEDSITIFRLKDMFYLEYEGVKTQLTENEIKTLRNFEIELNALIDGGRCTNHDVYILTYKNDYIFKTDSRCHWNGEYHLKKALGLMR